MKIRVCIPYHSVLDCEACGPGLAELSKYPIFEITKRQGPLIAQLRNSFIEGDYTHYLFIDSDIKFTAETVFSLIQTKRKIVGAPYPTRLNKNVYEAGKWKKPGIINYRFPISTVGLRKVDFIGMGMTLIEAEVFEKIRYPWFRHTIIKDKELKHGQDLAGEDYSFCMMANKKYGIWCHFDYPVEHISRTLNERKTMQVPNNIDESTLAQINELNNNARNYKILAAELRKVQQENMVLRETVKKLEKELKPEGDPVDQQSE